MWALSLHTRDVEGDTCLVVEGRLAEERGETSCWIAKRHARAPRKPQNLYWQRRRSNNSIKAYRCKYQLRRGFQLSVPKISAFAWSVFIAKFDLEFHQLLVICAREECRVARHNDTVLEVAQFAKDFTELDPVSCKRSNNRHVKEHPLPIALFLWNPTYVHRPSRLPANSLLERRQRDPILAVHHARRG